MRLTSLRLRNWGPFAELDLEDLPPLAVFVGANGSGKSALFDVFAFLRDSLRDNVRAALNRRGGFEEVRTRDFSGAIEITLQFRMDIAGTSRLVTYHLAVNCDDQRPYVEREYLRYKRGEHGAPFHYLDFKRGSGFAVVNESDFEEREKPLERQQQSLASADILAIKGLGQFERFLAASAFRRLIELWHLSDFHISDARPPPPAGYAEHLSAHGENLALVTQFIRSHHPDAFQRALEQMSRAVPGVTDVAAEDTIDGRVALRFSDSTFSQPFIAHRVSDGTIKMWAYLLLLHDPAPHPLLCIEEPENQLYPTLMYELLEELQAYAWRGAGQVLVSTHSPDLLNAAEPEEVFWLVKRHGLTSVCRASHDATITEQHRFGDHLGRMWRAGSFAGSHPR